MNLVKLGPRVRTGWVALNIVAVLIACGPASAQISTGKVLPTLKAEDIDGTKIEIAADSGRLSVRRGSATEHPRALAVHLFQPDCLQCQAQLKALDSVHAEYAQRGVLVIGIAYRGSLEAAKAVRRELGLKLTVGAASGLDSLGAGDASAITDGKGIVRFAQAGFGEGDQKLWREVLDAVLAGRPSPHETVSRKRLQTNDRFPSISLPSLRTGRPMSLSGAGGQLVFKSEDGATTKPSAVLFFFSRY